MSQVPDAGAGVPMYRVARRAGVGQATLYRHFPERALLAAAIYEQRLEHIAEIAHVHAGDPRAFLLLIEALIKENTRTPGLFRVLREGREGERYLRHLANRVLRCLLSRSVAPELLGSSTEICNSTTSTSCLRCWRAPSRRQRRRDGRRSPCGHLSCSPVALPNRANGPD